MRSFQAVPRALKRLMIERANASDPGEPARDADVDLGGPGGGVPCGDPLAEGLEVEQVNAPGSSEPARAFPLRSGWGA